ncbi:hypothetical protein BJ508DRAFT_369805 [Ascobolus immersus RN42]|uniref:Mannosyltransferase n=1 Tax=Ascobolus immersus RN42 TaxID=1160509 RepID=A0A3N4I784_ASCIM|nr:hypothetical protein BJ508DRAFT_369805 [Ascobolus immersus RN42]
MTALEWKSFVADKLIPLLIPSLVLLHLALAPYTKVEESFNLQAIHDILTYGIPKDRANALEVFKAEYDHFSFPGVVPRSFVGALVLAGASSLPVKLLKDYVNPQVVVRAVLGLFNSAALIYFGQHAKKIYGASAANWYYILQATQFHILFYASRTLPNMFAFGLTTIALAHFIPSPHSSPKLGIYLLTLSGILFRSEIALLLTVLVSYLYVNNKIRLFRDVLPAGLLGAIVGLGLTLTIDSFFWQSASPLTPFRTPFLEKYGLTWPELAAFHFNALQGKSAEWGTEPWHWYFTNALPRLLMNPFAVAGLIPFALGAHGIKEDVANIILPTIGFVAGYSALPHKEWRFVVYVIPQLTLCAALGADYVWRNRMKKGVFMGLVVVTTASIMASALGSAGMLLVSSLNYPGGFAVEKAYTTLPMEGNVTVHFDVGVCMTGATRFLQDEAIKPLWGERKTKPSGWTWDKTEAPSRLESKDFWAGVDYYLTSINPAPSEDEVEKAEESKLTRVRKAAGPWRSEPLVKGWGGVRVYRPGEEVGGYEDLFGRWGVVLDGVKERVRGWTGGWWVGPVVRDMVWVVGRGGGVGVPEDW